MSDDRKPTVGERIRDSVKPPQSLHGEGGIKVHGTEASYRSRGAAIEDPPEHGYRLSDALGTMSLAGEDMGPNERPDDADVLREQDVNVDDRLSDDVREAESEPDEDESEDS